MIKAIFFDVDGTLYSHELNRIPESVFRAFDELHARGVKLLTCTGRSYQELKNMGMLELPFDGHVLVSGQVCLGENGEVVFSSPIAGHDLEVLKKLYYSKEFTLSIVQDDGCFINVVTDDFVRIQESIHTDIYPIKEKVEGDVYLLTLFGNVHKTLDRYFVVISSVKALWWHEDAVDIIVNGAGKAAGIQKMMDYYGIDMSEVMAFGDSNNDLDMMNYVPFSVCMGNGREEVKKAASFVTDACYEDGIYKALKHFEII